MSAPEPSLEHPILDPHSLAVRARNAARELARTRAVDRERALACMARAVRAAVPDIISANALDLEESAARGLSSAMVDRLRLTPERIEAMAQAVDEIARMPDLIGRIEDERTRPNGLRVARMRIPLGVVYMIYESRPNVTTDAAALCIKSGNAVILRGGSEAFHSNQALGGAVARGLEDAGFSPDTVQIVASKERAFMVDLLHRDEDIDLVIPRGGEGLIRFVAEHSRIPVLKHYKGVCHVYVHADADLAMAARIVENAKVQRPGVCNAVETVLVDADAAQAFVPTMVARLAELGVEVRGDDAVCALAGDTPVTAAEEHDWSDEYLDLIVAMRVVPDMDAAIAHIERYGSGHTEAIVTENTDAAEEFLRQVGSSTVLVNASTRFADGGELGLGAEIGISTTRLHAYGPMGAEGLTTTKFVVRGQGQIRG